MLPKRSELPTRFGDIVLTREPPWTDFAIHMVFLPVPTILQSYLQFRGKPVSRIYVNKEMAPALNQAFGNIVDRGLQKLVNEYGGCFEIRKSRGRSELSVHSWGLAIDINPTENPLGSAGKMPVELVKCFTDAGFVWGGTFTRPDPMHFQYCTEG